MSEPFAGILLPGPEGVNGGGGVRAPLGCSPVGEGLEIVQSQLRLSARRARVSARAKEPPAR